MTEIFNHTNVSKNMVLPCFNDDKQAEKTIKLRYHHADLKTDSRPVTLAELTQRFSRQTKFG